MNRLTRVVDTSSKQSSVLETTRLDRHALDTLTTCNCYPDSTFRRHSSSRSPAVQPLIDDHLPQAHHLPQQLLQRELEKSWRHAGRESILLTDMTSLVRLYGGLRIGSFAPGAVNEDTIRASGRRRSLRVQGLSIDGLVLSTIFAAEFGAFAIGNRRNLGVDSLQTITLGPKL